MNSCLSKILSVALSFTVLFATSSFTLDMHLCCNKLVDIAVFGKAKPCNDKMLDVETALKKCSLGQMDCCSNSSLVKKGNENLEKVQFEFDAKNIVFLQTYLYTYVNLYEGLELKASPFTNYDPPFIKKDILLLDETFLI